MIILNHLNRPFNHTNSYVDQKKIYYSLKKNKENKLNFAYFRFLLYLLSEKNCDLS
jgi:hypothetical protein